MDRIHNLDNTFGAALIGVILASVLYGVSCSQFFYYFTNYGQRDDLRYKAVVIATMVSDTIHQALICHTIYSYLITNHFKPQKLDELVWSLLVEVLFNGITALLVQCFFAVRIWDLSRRWNRSITGTVITGNIGLFILAGFVSVIAYVVKSLPMATFVQLETLKPLSMVVNALAVVCDVLITIVSCITLHNASTGLPKSNTKAMINMLIAFSVQTGILTSLCAIASFISIAVSPDTFIYISFYFVLGRLYCNSLLGMLNVRNAIRERACSEIPFSRLPFPNKSNQGPIEIQVHSSVSHQRSQTPGPALDSSRSELGDRVEGRGKGVEN